MPWVHQVIFAEEFTAGPFQGIWLLIPCLILNICCMITTYFPSIHIFDPVFSVLQTHKTSALQELPSPPAAASRSRPSLKLESSDGEEPMDEEKEEKVKKESIKAPSGWKCAPCHARYTDREDYIHHMADQHGKVWKCTCLPKMYYLTALTVF